MLRAIIALTLAAFATLPAAASSTVRRDIDPAGSKATFDVSHIYVERVTGTVPIVSGTVELAEGSATPVSVTAVLDPTRIKSGDDDRDAALQGPDWFDVKRFPTWTFASTRITATSANAFAMEGILTIHGQARSERLAVTIGGTPARPVYHATGAIDRHAFGMTVTRLDPVIGNPIDVALEVTLK
ncbi:MAG: YceI family protein [Candidatus Tumulicola sp.]